MSGAIHQWTARQTRQAIRGKETSATEIAQALLARIARLDGRDAPGGGLGAFLHVDPARVLARAAALDAEHATAGDRPLFGVPVAVKDNLCTRDMPTTAASRLSDGTGSSGRSVGRSSWTCEVGSIPEVSMAPICST